MGTGTRLTRRTGATALYDGTGSIGPADVMSGAVGRTHYFETRNVIQIPFDDSLDSTNDLECFFQMPTKTIKIYSAKVWVQQKAFRSYVLASVPSGGGSSSGSGGGGTSATSGGASYTTVAGGSSLGGADPSSSGGTGSATDAQGSHNHAHGDPFTGDAGSHSHNVNSHTHTIGHSHPLPSHDHAIVISGHSHTTDVHSHSTPAHTHTLTPSINQSGPTGSLSLEVSDTTSGAPAYGGVIVSGFTSLTAWDLTGLTESSGNKRIRLTATGLQRVQVLIVLDLLIEVNPQEA